MTHAEKMDWLCLYGKITSNSLFWVAKRGRRKDYSTGEGLYLYIQQRQPRHSKLDILVLEGKAIPELLRHTIKEMLGAKGSDNDDNKTPMEVSDGDEDVVPFVDLA